MADELTVDLDRVRPHVDSTNPAVAIDAMGNFFVTWISLDTNIPNNVSYLAARAYNSTGQPQGDPFAPNGFGSGVQPPAIAANAAGEWFVSWTQKLRTIVQFGGSWFTTDDNGIRSRQFTFHHPPQVDLNGTLAGRDVNFVSQPIGSEAIWIAQNAMLSDKAAGFLDSGKVLIVNALAGDKLQVDTAGTNIVANFVKSVLSLSGHDTIEHYQQVLQSLRFSTTSTRIGGYQIRLEVTVNNGSQESDLARATISTHALGPVAILDRMVFYNNSGLDGLSVGIGPADDQAIATDKVALFPGQTASFANYTSYSRGINGIMLDIAGTHGAISADDLTFKVGNSNSPDAWNPAPSPLSVAVRTGAGLSGSDRVEIIWADGVLTNTWLQVTLAANGNTGLASPDTFYFGNAIGETGNSQTSAAVTAQDVAGTVWHLLRRSGEVQPAANSFDHNHDGRYTARDVLIAIQQLLRPHSPLELISPPGGIVASAIVSDSNAIASALAAHTPSDLEAEPPLISRPPVESSVSAPALPGLDARAVAQAIVQWPGVLVGCWLDKAELDVEESPYSPASVSLDPRI